jgi:hypothetical protein
VGERIGEAERKGMKNWPEAVGCQLSAVSGRLIPEWRAESAKMSRSFS